MKITFLLSSITFVRFLKRIEILSQLGTTASVFAFERKGTYPGKQVDFKIQKLGSISHGSYIRRIFRLLSSIKIISGAVKQTDVIYAFGLDMLFLGHLSKLFSKNKNQKLVYEVGDIRGIFLGETVINKLFRFFERQLLKKVTLLVITSKAYYEEYFLKIQKAKNLNFHVIENKIDPNLFQSIDKMQVSDRTQDVLTIGYFGVLRCERTWQILKMLADKAADKMKIYIRGVPGVGLENQLSEIGNIPNIIYDGPYVVPDDLQAMYEKVDIVWAAYPYQGERKGNWSWARTIRFYESCYFSKPVIVQKGTEDCKTVQEYDFGCCLDLSNVNEAVNSIMNISGDQILNWKQNVCNLPKDIYLLTNEHKELINNLN